MTYSFVQAKGSTLTVSGNSIAGLSSVPVGSLIVVTAALFDNTGNAFGSSIDRVYTDYQDLTLVDKQQSTLSGVFYVYQWYAVSTHAFTQCYIDWTANPHVDYVAGILAEFSGGPGTKGTSAKATGSSNSPAVSGFSPNSGSLIVASCIDAVGATSLTAGTSYTIPSGTTQDNTYTYRALAALSYRLSSTTSETAPFTATGAPEWGEVATEYLAGSKFRRTLSGRVGSRSPA